MTGMVAELRYLDEGDALAKSIADLWATYDAQRKEWKDQKKELRNYIFATDTSTTTNSTLPWKNSTTLPKLCQIRDNLHSNYLSALFPNDDWLRWEGYTSDDDTKKKRDAIQAYTSNKARESKLRITASKWLYDYIDYGMAFSTTKYRHEEKVLEDGEIIPGYIGPMAERISPLDIVFDHRAARFEDTWKVVRSLKTVGDIKKLAKLYPADSEMYAKLMAAVEFRGQCAGVGKEDWDKVQATRIDGFGTPKDYYSSGMVEILTFEGDIYDPDTGEYLADHQVIVIDRLLVVEKAPIPSWLVGGTIRHAGWRYRPDNLWSMGPLDNLVGMQYRIDHLENLRADVFDMIAHPVQKIKGAVDEYTYGPGAKIYTDEGDVTFMSPDTTALNADFQIQQLEQRMEEYAGAPREAMGIRTPGEKTKYEVQTLANAGGRIFQEKITSFEISLLEPTINDMLESAKRNMDGADFVRVMDDDLGVATLVEVTKEDITARGNLRPIGARHFAAQSQMVQNLTQLMGSGLANVVLPHADTMKITSLIEDSFNLGRYELFKKNQAIYEQAEAERATRAIQEELAAEAGITNQGEIVG